MLKTYQFKTHCKGDSHSSKTANIILPGLMIRRQVTPGKTKVNVLTAASEMVFKFNELQFNEFKYHLAMLVETTHLTQAE